MRLKGILLIILVGTLLGCISEAPQTQPATTLPQETSAPTSNAETLEPATSTPLEKPVAQAAYQLTFEATWSNTTHPTEFPKNPHFSGLIGTSHKPDVRLWRTGEKATPGIKNMSELGTKNPLDSEIESLIASGGACAEISGGGINPSPGIVSVTFTMTQDCKHVSVVSMIAPSPDWFLGVSGLNLYENGNWVHERIVELFAYDAGTDSGKSYASPNEPTISSEGIHRIDYSPVAVDGKVPAFGTFTFTRLDD